jgi:hypothetical protein
MHLLFIFNAKLTWTCTAPPGYPPSQAQCRLGRACQYIYKWRGSKSIIYQKQMKLDFLAYLYKPVYLDF